MVHTALLCEGQAGSLSGGAHRAAPWELVEELLGHLSDIGYRETGLEVSFRMK